MHNTHSYNPGLARRMCPLVEGADWQGLLDCLRRMTNSEFRTAGAMLSNNYLPSLAENHFWECFQALYGESPKAWLGTLLKAAVARYGIGQLHFDGTIFAKICSLIVKEQRKIDEKKLLQALLPVLKTPAEVAALLQGLALNHQERAVNYLLEQDTDPCCYILFQHLRQMDHDPEKISLYCVRLLQKGGDRAFNLVSIIKNYFDLPQVRGSFALKIPPYELSRLDTSYADFLRILTRI